MNKIILPPWAQYLLTFGIVSITIFLLYMLSGSTWALEFRQDHEAIFLGSCFLLVLGVLVLCLWVFHHYFSDDTTLPLAPWATTPQPVVTPPVVPVNAPPTPPPANQIPQPGNATNTPTPRTHSMWWRWLLGVLVIVAAIIGFLWLWDYLELPIMYLPHVATLIVIVWGMLRRGVSSSYHGMAIALLLAIMAIGGLLLPQYTPGYMLLTGICPLILSLALLYSDRTPGGDRIVAFVCLAYAVFVLTFFLVSLTGVSLQETILLGMIFALVTLALIPEVRSTFFPAPAGTTRQWSERSVWIVGILAVLLILGVIISNHGTGWFSMAGWVLSSAGLLVVLVAIWLLWPNGRRGAKWLITVIIVATLLWRKTVAVALWIYDGIGNLLSNIHDTVANSFWLYAAILIVFGIVGWMLATYLKIWRAVGLTVLLLLFFGIFGAPSIQWAGDTPKPTSAQNIGTEIKKLTGDSRRLDPGPGQDPSTIEVILDTSIHRG